MTRRSKRPTTLSSRLITAFASLILLVAMVGISSVIALELSTRSTQIVVHTVTPALEIEAANNEAYRDVQAQLRLAVASRDRALVESPAQARREMLARLQRVSSINHSPELADLVDRETAAIREWLDQDVIPVAEGRGTVVVDENYQEVLRAGLATRRWLEKDRQRLRDEAASYRHTSLLIVGIGTLLSILASIVIAVRAINFFVSPLREAVDGLERLRAGDLSLRLHPRGPQEVQLVGAAVNHLADQTALVRALREESTRLRRGTIEGALDVREKLEWGEVIQAGLRAIARTLDVDAVWFHPVEDTLVARSTVTGQCRRSTLSWTCRQSSIDTASG